MFLGIDFPSMWIVPLVGVISPVIILKVVLFPAPLVPNRQNISPFNISKETPLTAYFYKSSSEQEKQDKALVL